MNEKNDKSGQHIPKEIQEVELGFFKKPNEDELRVSPSVSFDRKFASESPETIKTLARYQFIYSLAGLILGLVCIIGGIVLLLNGVFGSTSWTASVFGAESDLSDAAPGTVLFIVGLYIVIVTRFVVKVRK